MTPSRQPGKPRPATLAASLLIAAGAALLLACGPFFPNRLILMGDSAVLSAPTAEFRLEVERTLPKGDPQFQSVVPADDRSVFTQSIDGDLADLKLALGISSTANPATIPAPTQALLDRYRAARVSLMNADSAGAAKVETPAGLPAEFDLYFRALADLHSGSVDAARARWRSLLEKPVAERQQKSVWAAFMLGKSYLETDPTQAITWFETTRRLRAEKFSDSIGLAASSLGWQARALLKQGDTTKAVELYIQQLKSGDPTALMSLRIVAVRAASMPASALEKLAAHELTRNVITAYIVSRGGPVVSSPRPLTPAFANTWLDILEKTRLTHTANADRLALASYQCGDTDRAARWLSLAGEKPLADWLRAKLLLRAGNQDDAVKLLAKASKGFPANEEWADMLWESDAGDDPRIIPSRQTLAEAGVILLSRHQFTDALDALLRGDAWFDAAHVAERVLTVDELMAFVDRAGPQAAPAAKSETGTLRHLLARRLARLNRFDEAARYMPASLQAQLKSLAQNLQVGRDTSKPKATRAAALWAAAKLTRSSGMELLGCELGPDGFIYNGAFPVASDTQLAALRSTSSVAHPSNDELTRVTASATSPDRRFHYRFLAANLGWEAAALMPDNDPATALTLCTAGSWIKTDDPAKADRFYKALVNRCSKTTLGAEANRLKWFPPLSEDPSNPQR